ncbi:LysR family transcriptional regulator [Stenotrophomonas sp. GD03701]|uniref:LysR family transcriptional regulator n=1 Tax=Stenotrophomonas TaxID=40323 RepID=UPI001EE45D27|nr:MULTISPECIES: LysR family transcriptional regulator [Stenotrophomonas]MDH1387665.1 LysR family transcriptional regulator [Stenotrophomonas sp. GD03701]MDH1393286.1 LysR family transcriptional regulator [Stenotrophomonas sp. GD03702]
MDGIVMRSSFDLNTVRVFVAVVDEQSFSGAARLLALPSSNVSRHVASLERNLGVRLLERSTRHLRMTEAGTLLYARAKPLLDTLLSTEEELGAVQRELKGPLRMCIPTEAPRLLAPILAEFCSLHPGIELECDTRLTGLEVLREDIDLSLFFHRGPQDDSAFITRVLATLPSIVVAAPALLARTGVPHRVHELKRFPCITTASALKGQPWQFLDATGNIVKVSVRSRYRVNSGELAVAGARQGLGFAIVAAHPCQDDIADGRLQEVQLDLLPAPLQLLGAYSHRHSVTARVRALLEFIQARLQPAAPVLRPDQSGR